MKSLAAVESDVQQIRNEINRLRELLRELKSILVERGVREEQPREAT